MGRKTKCQSREDAYNWLKGLERPLGLLRRVLPTNQEVALPARLTGIRKLEITGLLIRPRVVSGVMMER